MDQAKIDVAPDKKGQAASIHVTSKAALMARQEHYVRLSNNAHLEGEGRAHRSGREHDLLTPR